MTDKALTPKQESKEIGLTMGYAAIVDAEDYDRLNAHKWFAAVRPNAVYAARHSPRREKRSIILMHRAITGATPGSHVDHVNHNGLDNRKANLRQCSSWANAANALPQQGRSSRFKGVTWYKPYRKWRAYISPGGKFLHLGYFEAEADAALAYNAAAEKHFGSFSYLNMVA